MSAQELYNEIIEIWGNATGNDEFFSELGDAEQRIQSQHRHKGRKSRAEELTILEETTEQMQRFQLWQAGQGQPLAQKEQATVDKMKAGAA
ncbi:MAG: hypothetical protein EZS28_045436 [Streblomastix strix]|uniref:Uncharacterized protein n=1 Tax=Streblomastix strix TaxID=222440 RepID=A0A5J4TL64_9EUKA|nr:MAG: hypothetical protein EZS28_045436 [Streblomastix strix]